MQIGRIYTVVGALVIISIIVVLLRSPFVIGLISLGLEDELAKWSLDNTYIDRGMRGWKTVSIDGFDSFKIPGEWTFSPCDSGYQIQDSSGGTLAYATLFGDSYHFFDSWDDFFTSFMGFEAIEESRAHFNGITTAGTSYYCEISLRDTNEMVLCCLNLENYDTGDCILIVFPPDSGISSAKLHDIIAAIAYSFDY
jgi:hypothetical protein